MGLKEAWKKFEAGVDDLATLDVVTLSGTIELNNTAGAGLELKNLPDQIQAAIKAGTTNVSVKVVAFTHVEGDLDTTHFVQTAADPSVLDAHKEIVSSAHEARNGFLRLVKQLFTGL